MLFIQFYTRSATNPDRLIEGCGTDAVFQLDVRSKPSVADALKRLEQLRHVKRWDGFAFYTGPRLSDAHSISPVYRVLWVKPDDLSVPRKGEGLFPVCALASSKQLVSLRD